MAKPKLKHLSDPGMVESKIIKTSKIDSLGKALPSLANLHPEEEKEEMIESQEAPIEVIEEKPKKEPMPEMESSDDHERYTSIAEAIMAKKAKKMAEGGQVDLDENAEEQPNAFYKRNQEILKENYDSDMDDLSQPEDSNLIGDPEEMSMSDAHDMISKLRSKIKQKMSL